MRINLPTFKLNCLKKKGENWLANLALDYQAANEISRLGLKGR